MFSLIYVLAKLENNQNRMLEGSLTHYNNCSVGRQKMGDLVESTIRDDGIGQGNVLRLPMHGFGVLLWFESGLQYMHSVKRRLRVMFQV